MTRTRHTFTDKQWVSLAPVATLQGSSRKRTKCIRASFQGVQQLDLEEVMLDSTCCRAHQASAGTQKKSSLQVIGITHGGRNTKIHAVCNALGNPLRFLLTSGQWHDSKPVPELLECLLAKAILADKAYDSNKIIQSAQEQGTQPIIPSKVNRK